MRQAEDLGGAVATGSTYCFLQGGAGKIEVMPLILCDSRV